MTNKSTSKFVMGFAMFVLVALILSGCGGGGDSSTSIPATPVTPPAKMSEALTLPAGHGLAVGEFTLQPGASDEYGNVVVSCPAGGGACVVTVSADGTATYDRTGGAPSVMAAYQPWTLPPGHGLAVGEFTLQPGASDEYGNVVVSCPAGGNACVVTVSADGTATYDRTGGAPSVMAAYQPWTLPPGHGLAVGEFTLQPGASDEYGNVVVSCPAGGGACVVTVSADGTATYDRTGGMPSVMAAYQPWTLPPGHGLAVGEFTIRPGASDEYGNAVLSCPAGGAACVVTVAADGTATYDRTGGMPTVMLIAGPLPLPRPPETGDLEEVALTWDDIWVKGHNWIVGYTIQAGRDETFHGLNFACPAGGPNCKVKHDPSGTHLKWIGARPIVTRTVNPHNITLPAEHGLTAGQIRIEADKRELLGNVLFACWVSPCVLTVAADGKASFDPFHTAGDSGSYSDLDVYPMHPVPLPPNHGLTIYNDDDRYWDDPGRIELVPGTSVTYGNATISCPTGSALAWCVLYILPDGKAVADRDETIPTVVEAGPPWRLGSGLGLAAGEIMLKPGAWEIYNDVKISCPTDGAACIVKVTADGTAHYDPTGGIPHLVTGYTPLVSGLPPNHGLSAGEIIISSRPGSTPMIGGTISQVHGNVLIGCPNFIDICRIAITEDGRVYRTKWGGIPWIQPVLAHLPLAQGHGLAAGEVRLGPGVSTTRGDTSISCPSGGHACTLVVAKDGTASFQKTGNTPIVTVPQAYARENLWAEDLRDHWNEPKTLRDGMNLSAVGPSSATQAKNVLETLLDGADGNAVNGGDKLRNVRPGDVEIIGERDGITYGHWKGGPAGTLNIEFAFDLVPGYLNLDFDETDKRVLHAWAQRVGKLWSRRLRDNFDKRVLEHDDGLGFALGFTEDLAVDDIIIFLDNQHCVDDFACAFIQELEATEDDFEPWASQVGLIYSAMRGTLETLTRAPMSWSLGDTMAHEIGHALGLGIPHASGLGIPEAGGGGRHIPSVDRYVNRQNHTFEGPEATKANGGNAVPFQWRMPGSGAVPPNTPGAEPDYSHPGVCNSVMSYPAAHCDVNPITPSEVDFAWLSDIGYELLDANTASEPEVYGWGAWGRYSAWGVGAKRVLIGPMEDMHGERFYDDLYARADAFGIAPDTSLTQNPVLTGTVAWSGSLLGVDLGQDMLPPVVGEAEILVELSSLDGTARFNGLAVFVENEPSPFRAPNLEYAIRVTGNSFSDADGRIGGAFYGPAHEEVAGVLDDRASDVNLLAGFGGKR